MPNFGNAFRDEIANYIRSWGEPLQVMTEINVGYRFVSTPRKLDVVIRNTQNNRYMAVECKVQLTQGSAYEKFSYTLDDCLASPIPTIIAFAGDYIRDDMKSKLIMSGIGIELQFTKNDDDSFTLEDPKNLFRQRCYIELGLNWFAFATGDRAPQQISALFTDTDNTDETGEEADTDNTDETDPDDIDDNDDDNEGED